MEALATHELMTKHSILEKRTNVVPALLEHALQEGILISYPIMFNTVTGVQYVLNIKSSKI